MFALLLLLPLSLGATAGATPALDPVAMERFANLALGCVDREYPNKISHVLGSDGDVRPPRELTPAFFGCYDWHSSVHAHWLLARLARLHPGGAAGGRAREILGRHLTAGAIAAEVHYLQGTGRVSFERPYGLAWLLQLATELREWSAQDPRSGAFSGSSSAAGDPLTWSKALAPLERAAADRIREWVPKLTHPIRSGEHSQTAFAFGLILDWARGAADAATASTLASRVRAFYEGDRDCPLSYEPSGEDFLSPCLAEADLMRRVLPPARYAEWLQHFMPAIPPGQARRWIEPAMVTDPGDPKLAHLDGLNLSRAWMLEGMASGLPAGDARIARLRAAAQAHRDAGLRAVTGEHYEGGHWLGTFAVYLVTGRGLSTPRRDPL
jgi:Protein of unknown function (DUF2891)